MFINQSCNDGSINPGWIKFVSHITDSIVANGRRSEYSDIYRYSLNTGTTTYWETKIPEDWEEDDKFCLITQFKTPLGGSPTFALALGGSNLHITTLNDTGKTWLYNEKMIKGERLKFKSHIRWTALANGYIQIWMNGRLIVDYSGVTYYEAAEEGPYFKMGLYMDRTSEVVKRVIKHKLPWMY